MTLQTARLTGEAIQVPIATDATTSRRRIGKNDLPKSTRRVFPLLLQAHEYAKSLGRGPRDFALELPQLLSTGGTVNDIRWLLYNGLVDHTREITTPDAEARTFCADSGLTFDERSCFILTTRGVTLASSLPDTLNDRDVTTAAVPALGSELIVPVWDNDRREFRFAGRLVKHFKLPSPNQETVLNAFQEDGWPTRIDDPLPPVSSLDPKRRLHDTIKSLNRHQKSRQIRFMGDGRGEGILWEPMEES